MGWSINISKSQIKSTQDPMKLNTKLQIHDIQLSNITLNNKTRKIEAYHIQAHARNKTNTCKGASNFQCLYELNTCYRKEEALDMR